MQAPQRRLELMSQLHTFSTMMKRRNIPENKPVAIRNVSSQSVRVGKAKKAKRQLQITLQASLSDSSMDAPKVYSHSKLGNETRTWKSASVATTEPYGDQLSGRERSLTRSS